MQPKQVVVVTIILVVEKKATLLSKLLIIEDLFVYLFIYLQIVSKEWSS